MVYYCFTHSTWKALPTPSPHDLSSLTGCQTCHPLWCVQLKRPAPRKWCKKKGFLKWGGIPKTISFNTKIYEHCLMLLDDLEVPPWENLKEKVPRDTHVWGCNQVGAAWGCTRISKILVVIFETSDWVFIAYPAAPLVFMQLHAMLIHIQQEPFQKDRERSSWSICSWGLPKTMFLSMDWFQGKFTGKPEI